ncbi:DUF669 domain-containing protein [Pseudaminobacter sp. NGMCC 1.201702]|uniref:DUF669 domain-containing protein n=1 Tax=Pseudaminobacter sp. NGMCC 1.201702 TaxID=3391825 RepID=UPI0039EE5BDF
MAKFGVSIAVTEESTEQREFPDLPSGVFKVEISAAEVRRKNEGEQDETAGFNATFDVIEPEELHGRKFFNYYNLTHPNPEAQRIGQEEFSRLRRALGFGDVDADMEEQDVIDEMRLVPLIVTYGMGKDSKKKNPDGTPKYPAQMGIRRYWYPDLNDAPPIGVAAAANDNRPAAKVVAKPATPAATGGSKPWKK